MASRPRSNNEKIGPGQSVASLIDALTFWLSLSALVIVPLAFSTSVHRTFSLPKFLVLLTLSSALVPLVSYKALLAGSETLSRNTTVFRHTLLTFAYLVVVATSTFFGAAPWASFFGSFENKMGLITQLCFIVCFLGLTLAIGRNRARLMQTVWALLLTGCGVAIYAFIQFFGRDPFLPLGAYTFSSAGQSVIRAVGTLGHPDYLGNFLLYITPLAVSVALASSDIARRFAVATAALSVAAIAFSGTRGAWLGIFTGGATLIAIEALGHRRSKTLAVRWRPIIIRIAIGVAVISLSVLLISSARVSHGLVARARLLFSLRDAGAGRTLLWRDSVRMAVDSPLVGCGPEGFRKSFLSYKSLELSRFAPDINNESTHNSYIDAAVSYGLPGATLYVAIIGSTFFLFWKARRRTADPRLRLVISGLLSSFAAVVTHNFFIFDQVSTGLYFFGFVATASAVTSIVAAEGDNGAGPERGMSERIKHSRQHAPVTHKQTGVGTLAICGILLVGAGTYSLGEMTRDRAIGKALAAAAHADLNSVIDSVERSTRTYDPTGQYDFAAARALTLCAEQLKESKPARAAGVGPSQTAKLAAIDLAIAHASRSADRSLTPDSNYVLLAYLALLGGDTAKLKEYAGEAVRSDPYSASARWLMAEAFLAEGNRDEASREARFSATIDSSSDRTRITIERAQGESETRRLKTEKAISNARLMISKGKLDRAELVLRRAVSRSWGPCPECHRLLATVYEEDGRYLIAIQEWQTFITQTPDRPSVVEAEKRIEMLRQKSRTR